jgi:site-specific DNA-methyltransferase (adenine-specific)
MPRSEDKLPLNQIVCGDCLEVMKTFPPESIDLIATDPPYGYSFMGKDWDKAVPSVEVWKECLRVLKSGAFMFVMSAPRQDVLSQMIIRLGQAGFDTGFTSVYWAYASGFPKAMNVSKAVDKRLGVERKITGKTARHNGRAFGEGVGDEQYGTYKGGVPNQTEPSSEEAKALDGSYGGFQPKPAVEIIIVCMKPLGEKTFVEQALKNGKGVTWLDDARIPFVSDEDMEKRKRGELKTNPLGRNEIYGKMKIVDTDQYLNARGRFPANLLVSDDVLNDGTIQKSTGHFNSKVDMEGHTLYEGGFKNFTQVDRTLDDSGGFSRYFDLDKWFEKTVLNLPESVRKTFPFLICPKASKSERNKGCENIEPKAKCDIDKMGGSKCTMKTGSGNDRNTSYKNFHPTVKPLKLMSYLVTLGSREGDVVLDPFVGSGTTCLASEILSRQWIGIDINPEYCEITQKRIATIPEKLDGFIKIPEEAKP